MFRKMTYKAKLPPLWNCISREKSPKSSTSYQKALPGAPGSDFRRDFDNCSNSARGVPRTISGGLLPPMSSQGVSKNLSGLGRFGRKLVHPAQNFARNPAVMVPGPIWAHKRLQFAQFPKCFKMEFPKIKNWNLQILTNIKMFEIFGNGNTK